MNRIELQQALWPEFSQLGIIVRDVYKTIDYYSSFGLRPWVVDVIDSQPLVYRPDPVPVKLKIILCFYKLKEFELELMQPLEGEGYQMDCWCQMTNLGLPSMLSHVSTHVTNIAETLKLWEEKGVQILQTDELGHHKYAYLNTQSLLGINLKLIQRC